MLNYFLIIFILFLITEYYFHLKFKNRVENDFPKNILIDYKEEILPQIDKGKNIPFIIYRTYYDKEIAKKFIKAKEITLKNNPNLIEKFFDDSMIDDYIKKNFSHRIYNAYNSINKDYGPARADFFRYLVIYKEGGIYLDIDSVINKNLDSLEQNIKVDQETAIKVSKVINRFCDDINDHKDISDPTSIRPKDILHLALILEAWQNEKNDNSLDS